MGEDADGHPLTENATIHDVGLGGISFFLTSPVAVGQVLDLILSSREFGTLEGSATFRVQATVLRSARPSRAVRPCFVAAEFKGEFATLNCAINLVTTADEIKKAVQFDERMREGTMPLGWSRSKLHTEEKINWLLIANPDLTIDPEGSLMGWEFTNTVGKVPTFNDHCACMWPVAARRRAAPGKNLQTFLQESTVHLETAKTMGRHGKDEAHSTSLLP
jgi:hypothetical protein